jgi:3-phenylpropionate/trans-cinnamate dioxygenase ferredoxin reductase subunit
MKNGVIIVGTGHGGVQAAASLREEGFEGPVTLVGEETDLPYHRPPLSKAYLKSPDATPQVLRGEGFYGSSGIDLRLGTRAEAIDRAARELLLADGSRLPFDRLILATGSRARALPGVAAGLGGLFLLRTAPDARAIRDAAVGASSVVVIGGGFIGLEAAATLAAGGRRVTVVEAQDRLLARALPPVISGSIQALLARNGVEILLDCAVQAVEAATGRVTGVLLTDGRRIEADMILAGIGAAADTTLALTAGLSIGNGILVDGTMRTSVPEILAIGDAVTFPSAHAGTGIRLESVQNATDQARAAARTIVGRPAPYDAVPWFWSDIADAKLQMVGLPFGADRSVVSGDPDSGRFAVYRFAGPRLVGIDTVNRPADHMLGRRMLAAGFSPSDEDVTGDRIKDAFTAWSAATPRV